MTAKMLTALMAAAVWFAIVPAASAQPLGIFNWQLSPHCNVVSLAVTQNGSTYRLEGFDDQCGTTERGTVIGMAVPNANGTFEMGLTIISATGAAPSHIDATISLPSIGGPWRDSAGNSGTMIYSPVGAAGPVRPAGLGGAAIDSAQIQRRVSGTCGAGEFIQTIAQDGSVTCAADTSGTGDITGVTPGPGLSGGGASGSVVLSVDFFGTGLSTRVARSDHNHALASDSVAIGEGANASNQGIGNVAVGASALAGTTGVGNVAVGIGSMFSATTAQGNTAVGATTMQVLTTGGQNVGVGFSALQSITTGSSNTAVGTEALEDVTTGSENTAVGGGALNSITTSFGSTAVGFQSLNGLTTGSANVGLGQRTLRVLTTGVQNTAVGSSALVNNITGNNNVAIGAGALDSATGSSNTAVGSVALNDVTSGGDNIAIGLLAGDSLTTGSDNIYIGAEASVFNEAGTIRIGDADQTRAFIAGVSGVAVANSATVLLNTNTGQLGTVVSSARFKEEIRPIGEQVDRLRALRPVSFYYKPEHDAAREPQFGLIAEDVAETMPELVVRDADGRPLTVRYHLLAPLLLAEVQRLERERAALERRLSAQEREMAELRAKHEGSKRGGSKH